MSERSCLTRAYIGVRFLERRYFRLSIQMYDTVPSGVCMYAGVTIFTKPILSDLPKFYQKRAQNRKMNKIETNAHS